MNWLYFLLIGWWLGPLWFVGSLLMCWNPIGWVMVHKTPKMMLGE